MKINLAVKNMIVMAAALSLPFAASANLVINGDFSAGNADFTSGYTYATPGSPSPITGNPNTMWDEGTYTVYNNINALHSSWTFGPTTDPTGGHGNMMVVNGATTPGVMVWGGDLSSGLVAGQAYQFSVYLASIYTVSAPSISVTVGGVNVGPFTTPAGQAGVWNKYTVDFVAQSSGITAIDLNTQANGNDFALDDMSIVAVPEASTAIAGALLLLPFGACAVRILRKNPVAYDRS